jgi:alkanesulfonate monooxygenase
LKLGIRLPTYAIGGEYLSPENIKNYVETAEEMGVDGFFMLDHMLISPPAYNNCWVDPLIGASFIASWTKRAKVGTMVLVLPPRNPYALAKEIATIDVYSNGRFILGAGVGWNPEEFELYGRPLNERGRIMDEMLPLMKLLWSEGPVDFEGKYFHAKGVNIFPKPKQRPHPPIWLGGGSQPFEKIYGQQVMPQSLKRVLQRVVREADGWIPHSSATAEDSRRDWEYIKEYSKELGKDPYKITRIYSNFIYVTSIGGAVGDVEAAFKTFSGMDFEYWKTHYLVGTVEELTKKIKEKIDAVEGSEWIVLSPPTLDRRQLKLIVEEIFPKLNK